MRNNAASAPAARPGIPAPLPPARPTERRGVRVCAYCRVSTQEESQAGSLQAQADHWRQAAARQPGWTLVAVYVERGLSATHAATRPELTRLLEAAARREVDLVLTKSISRFSRNTADCLSLVRTLAALGTAVFFEKENIHTGEMESELFLSVLASLAADESRSLSRNVKWGYTKRFERGEYKYKQPPYGYTAPEGVLKPEPGEARVVEEIFARALQGQRPGTIAAALNRAGVPTKRGGSAWKPATVTAIVGNLTYTGDALFQKTFRDAEYRAVLNRGQEDRYYVPDHHEALVSREIYLLANERMGDREARERLARWQAAAEGAAVAVIRATQGPAQAGEEPRRLRVAAYCRVSTDSDAQENSYEVQCTHYHGLITHHPGWALAGIYADEGISGTSTRKREGFNALMADCEAGRIDLVLTKSISRFARNTLDCLVHIRRLKALGVAVEFEKEAINTLDAKGEVLLTIMASIAQQESQSISQNVRLGIQYRFQQGKAMVNESRFLGYTKTPAGRLVIDPAQAAVVRRIYRAFLEGESPEFIANTLRAEGVRSGSGNVSWPTSAVRYILLNEKYAGNLLLQKTYVPDFLNHRSVKNLGALPQYLVEGSHEAIVPPEVFAMAQDEMRRRSVDAEAGRLARYGSRTALKGRTFCACGGKMTRGRWKSAKWVCTCGRAVSDETVKQAVLAAVNALPARRAAMERRLQAAMERRAAAEDACGRAVAAAEAMRIRLALETVDAIEGRTPEPPAARACVEARDFWNRTRHVRRPGPVCDWIDEDIIRLVEKVIVGDDIVAVLRARDCDPDEPAPDRA